MHRRVAALLAPLNERSFRVLWLAQLTSETGDWAARLALSLLVFDRTGSPTATTLVLAASFLPWLGAGQLLASVADGRSRQRVMVTCDVLHAAMFCLMTLPLALPAILGLVFLAGIASAPFSAARAALLPDVVSAPRYPAAVTLTGVTSDATVLVASVVAGALVAIVGAPVTLVLNAVTFIVSAALVRRVRSAAPANRDPVGRRLRHAAAFLCATPLLRRAVLLGTVPAASAAAVEALVVVYADGHAAAAGGFAAVLPAATMAVAPLLPADGANERLLRASAVLGFAGAAVTLACFLTLPAGSAIGALGFAGAGVLFAVLMPANTVVGRVLPGGLRASSFGLLMGVYMAGQAAGAIGGGLLAERFGVRAACAAAMLPALVATAACWRPRDARRAAVGVPAVSMSPVEPDAAAPRASVGYARGA
ncbi:MAG: MFS transporter [Mycobacterium leprae]